MLHSCFPFLSAWDVEREKLALGGGRLRARCGGAAPQPPPWAAAPFKSIPGLYLSPVQTPLCECRPLIIRCQEEMGWPRAAGSLWPSLRAGDTAPTPGLRTPNMTLSKSPGHPIKKLRARIDAQILDNSSASPLASRDPRGHPLTETGSQNSGEETQTLEGTPEPG